MSHFNVQVTQGDQRTLTVTGPEIGNERPATRSFSLGDSSHAAYKGLHQWLSDTFGTSAGSKEKNFAPPSTASYEPLLTENISPKVLYGYGDPCVIRVPEADSPTGWGFYLYVTSNDAPDSFPILRSPDLKGWELKGFMFPEGQKPVWVMDGEGSAFWAPETRQLDDKFIACFTARDKDSGALSIGLARRDTPAGAFVGQDRPILTDGVIDGHIFVTKNSVPFLFWKEDNNDKWPSFLIALLEKHPDFIPTLFPQGQDQKTAKFVIAASPWIRSLEPMERFQMLQPFIESVTQNFGAFRQKLLSLAAAGQEEHQITLITEAMLTPFYKQQIDPDTLTLIGERSKVTENDQEWEAHVIEGMYVVQDDVIPSDGLTGNRTQSERLDLVYAGNDFATVDYGIGAASADHIEAEWVKQPRPIAQSTAEWEGIGHPSIVLDLNDRPKLMMHGFKPGRVGYKVFRALLAADLVRGPEGIKLAQSDKFRTQAHAGPM